MEIREQLPISPTYDRKGERNPRVFLKAKVIQASSQLNTDRDKIFQFLDNHQIWISVKLILRNNLGLECTIILFRS